VYENSPAGEGGAYEKAYAAAFVLLLSSRLNIAVARRGGTGRGTATPPPIAGRGGARRGVEPNRRPSRASGAPRSGPGASRRRRGGTVSGGGAHRAGVTGPSDAHDTSGRLLRQARGQGVSIRCAGQVLALIGLGCGKTTLLRSLNR
jgi:hypothetical protein